jgi:hypothetical protein
VDTIFGNHRGRFDGSIDIDILHAAGVEDRHVPIDLLNDLSQHRGEGGRGRRFGFGNQISMSQSSPIITKETTMWQCWVGFNASHSLGLILFGLVFGYLALAHGQLLFRSPFLLVVGLAMLGGFVVLCKVYFFSVPLTGVSISLACYVASIALSRA